MTNECPICSANFNRTREIYTFVCRFCSPREDNSQSDEDLEDELNLLLNPSGKTQVKDYEKD